MPLPKREKDEEAQKFMGRCMSSNVMREEYPEQKQRVAVCTSQSRQGAVKGNLSVLVQEELVYAEFQRDCVCGEVGDPGPMSDYVFKSKEAAEKKAEKIGLKGAHEHEEGWMPGAKMKDFESWYSKHKAHAAW